MALVMTPPVQTSAGSHTSEPLLSVAAVARRLGVAPATLRTWDRRYGLGPTGHTVGRHRKYGPSDVARLELMQRALLRGASSAEAARFALDSKSAMTHGVVPVAPSGGRGLKMPGASRLARGLGRAAVAMDSIAVQGMLADSLASDGVIATWNEVVRPVLTAVAARWQLSGTGVEVEHLLNECVLAAFVRATPLVTLGRNHRPVLLACMPEERHNLPLYPLAAELAQRGVVVRQLGAALPMDALAAAVRRTAPSAVVLWAQLPRYADPGVISALPRTRQQVRVFVGGPGWTRGVVTAPAERVEDLAAAVDAVEAAVT
ncbi:MerR-like DNA binding protein [Lentzea flaviverrucosa]|uniref:MerR HTH family regulatory protein n=2 Tax=Lentzea flaviverrucosa TaxID=200379 RepID=A0A1H9XYM6_9PSEU|nr:MerR-like DNA binding protein [Lentzea flaviverrucosa]SES51184.1 MerR HTH family regulatory protein [Lentzea flaviverrucosa]